MESFRKFLQGWIGRTLLVLVLVVFVVTMFWDSTPPLGARGELADVNGTPVTKTELDQAYDAELARYGDQIDRKTLEQFIKRDVVLERLIRQRALVDAASGLGLVVDQKMVDETIISLPAFQDESGKFSEERFRAAIYNNGFANAAAFGNRVRESLLSQQVQGAIEDSSFATRQDLELLTRIGEQKRDVAWVIVNPAEFVAGITVTDAEIQTRYDGNPAGYLTPEQFAIEYVEIKQDDYAAAEQVTEEAVRARYDEMVARVSENAERRIAHILISTSERTEAEARARADEVLARLAKGEAFATLAASYSDDTGSAGSGGDLGYLGRGVLEAPLDAAVAALKTNDVSPAVKSADGLHLLKVLDVRAVETPAFASVRADLAAGLQRDQARARYDELVEQLGTAAYESDNLQDVAQKLSLQVRSTGLFGRSGGPGIAGNAKVLDEVFSADVLEDGRNSGVVDVAEGHVVVVRVKEHRIPARRPLAEVSAEIKAELIRERSIALAREKAARLLAAVAAGQALESQAQGLAVQRVAAVQRSGQGSSVPRELIQAAFKAKRPATGASSAETAALADGSQAVLVVSNAVDGSLLGVTDDELMARRMQLGKEYGRIDFVRFVDAALATAEVKRLSAAEAEALQAPATSTN